MRMLIHDLEDEEKLAEVYPYPLENMVIISNEKEIHYCLRCFACWVKTPAQCIIQDNCGNLGQSLSKCKEISIVSKCCYGGFSPFVKNVLDRSISYLHPYFEVKMGKLHHKRRYKNQIDLYIYFYGEQLTEEEKKTAKDLVEANAVIFGWRVKGLSFDKCGGKMGVSNYEDSFN